MTEWGELQYSAEPFVLVFKGKSYTSASLDPEEECVVPIAQFITPTGVSWPPLHAEPSA